MRPLLVVDSPSLLFRAFYGLPRSILGAEGRPVNALLGGANLTLREIAEHEPRAVVQCFGPDAAPYRTELFDGYHADREEMPDEIAWQFEVAPEFFAAFGWSSAYDEQLEADDLLHSFARAEADAGGACLILTGDRDMFQSVTERVRVLYLSTGVRGGQPIDPAEVERRYGVPPSLVPDFIALRGDPSDGIPGARGIGPKRAAEILGRCGSLEAALEGAAEAGPLGGPAAERLLAYKEIATLRTVPVQLPPDASTDFGGAALAARELGMNRLAERLLDR